MVSLRALIVLFLACCYYGFASHAHESNEQAIDYDWIAQQVFNNECAERNDLLLSWNEGEHFASLGIGHFIWYPQGANKPFQESFPALLHFLQQQGYSLPSWLTPNTANPWPTRADFLQAKARHDPRIQALYTLLLETKAEQAAWIAERFTHAIPTILQHITHSEEKQQIAAIIHQLRQHTHGMYALMDYVNFKGEGIATSERYQGQGWGLLQVLQRIRIQQDSTPINDGQRLLQQFAQAATFVLQQRIHNAPKARHEERWLAGWLKRVQRYQPHLTE